MRRQSHFTSLRNLVHSIRSTRTNRITISRADQRSASRFVSFRFRIFSSLIRNVRIYYLFSFTTLSYSQYCTGYVDKKGKWRNGFYCPGETTSSSTRDATVINDVG